MSMHTIPFRFRINEIVNNKLDKCVELSLSSTITINDENDQYQCILKNFWVTTPVIVDQFIHIFSPRIEEHEDQSKYVKLLIVDREHGLVVVQPDTLIAPTKVLSASYCMRKTWLSELFKPSGDYSKVFAVGNLVHEIFQTSLMRSYTTLVQVEQLFRTELLPKETFNLYCLNMTQSDMIEEVKPYLQAIADWLAIYAVKNKRNDLFTFESLHDIENEIWSTKYGLKGKIDASLNVSSFNASKGTNDRYLVPLELKSGKHSKSNEHLGQVLIYLYMMADKFRIDHAQMGPGFLLYLKNSFQMKTITAHQTMFRDIIRVRNELIQYHEKLTITDPLNITSLSQFKVDGPQPVNFDRACSNCEHLLDCALVTKCFESTDTNKTLDLAEQALAHLEDGDLSFFSHMVSLLEIERLHCKQEDDAPPFWNIRSEDCEQAGIGIAKLAIREQDEERIVFERNQKFEERLQLPSQLLSQSSNVNYALLVDRQVVISEELSTARATHQVGGNFCSCLHVAIGSITSFSDDRCCIEVSFHKPQLTSLNPKAIYRLDLRSSSPPVLANYSNLLRLMEAKDDKARELRGIVISGKFPYRNINKASYGAFEDVYNSRMVTQLNSQQKKAVLGALRTKASLIFGSPGAGKTQAIVALVQVIVHFGFSVLLTGYTHVAVDNILLKLVQANQENGNKIQFVRIGSKHRIHPSLQEYTDYEMTKNWLAKGDVGGLEGFYSTVPVVGVTCLGISKHPIFAKRVFDFCVVDEASQVFLPTSLGPIFLSHNFVLVGDQNQLPPVIRSPFARSSGLENTLFTRLMGFVKQEDETVARKNLSTIQVYPLYIQYRMNQVIMDVANRLTYNNKLSCGNADVEKATLKQFIANNKHLLEQYTHTYMCQALSPELEDSFVFLDTDSIAQAAETNIATVSTPVAKKLDDSFGDGQEMPIKRVGCVYNSFEASMIVHLVQDIMKIYGKGNNLKESNIGIISPFRRQVHAIKEAFGLEYVRQHHLEVNTVDQYQGRDKEVIIYSCVKSFCKDDSPSSSPFDAPSAADMLREDLVDSELLKDQRRLNVAITRAKKKMIIVGNRSTLARYEPFKQLFDVLSESQFVKVANYGYEDILNDLMDEEQLSD